VNVNPELNSLGFFVYGVLYKILEFIHK